MAIENNIDTVTIFVIFHFIKLPQKKMRMATLWNIAIFTVLLSNVMHIFFVNFERTKERENSPVSTLWTFFKNSENKYRRKILTEKEEDTNDDFLTDFIVHNNVSFSDCFLSLVDTGILEDIDVKEKEKTESINIQKDTDKKEEKEEKEEKMEKKTRRYRACCKLLGKQCNRHNRKRKNRLTEEKTEDTTVEQGEKEVEETPEKEINMGYLNATSSNYYKSKLRMYGYKGPIESEENNENTERPLFVPKVPKRKYGNIYLTKFDKELAKQKNNKLMEIYSYKKKSSINEGINKDQDPGVSNISSYNKELGKKKPSMETNVACNKRKLVLHDDSILSEVKSERNIYDYDSEEDTSNTDSDSSDNSVSSHDLWEENKKKKIKYSDTETEAETEAETETETEVETETATETETETCSETGTCSETETCSETDTASEALEQEELYNSTYM